MRPIITYHYRGGVERGIGNCYTRPGYAWNDGFSENSPSGRPLMGWMTRNECMADAKARGAKAVFARPEGAQCPQ